MVHLQIEASFRYFAIGHIQLSAGHMTNSSLLGLSKSVLKPSRYVLISRDHELLLFFLLVEMYMKVLMLQHPSWDIIWL